VGKQNRARRAAKQRARQRPSTGANGAQSGPDWFRANEPPRVDSIERLRLRLRDAALASARGDRSAGPRCAAELAILPRPVDVDRGAEQLMDAAIAAAWKIGWLPVDLKQLASRRQQPLAVTYLVDAVAAQCRQYAAGSLHPRWRAQLADMGAEVWWRPDQPHLSQWAERHGCGRGTAIETMIDALALQAALVPLPVIVPPPGSAVVGAASVAHLDDKVLARVRGLLAKAESTTFPEEAEALSAKAQELMSRHAIERAVLDAREPGSSPPTARRLWLDRPYVAAKASLAGAVAQANRCRTVLYEDLGFVTVVGADVDLDIVELLTTSLLLQATRAMLVAGSQLTRSGQSRTRSYRQSFLIAYAGRIAERLSAATETASSEVDAGTLLPVLAGREAAVDEVFGRLFARTTARSFSVGNSDGWYAGRAAADLAVLQGQRAVGS